MVPQTKEVGQKPGSSGKLTYLQNYFHHIFVIHLLPLGVRLARFLELSLGVVFLLAGTNPCNHILLYLRPLRLVPLVLAFPFLEFIWKLTDRVLFWTN